MNETHVTVLGNLVADPTERIAKNGSIFTTFKIASTPWRPPREEGEPFYDGPTSFYNVIAWRALAGNILASLHKGDPVVVAGRLAIREYERADETHGVSAEIEATCVGPDLTKGTTKFRKGRIPRLDPRDRNNDEAVTQARTTGWDGPYLVAGGNDPGDDGVNISQAGANEAPPNYSSPGEPAPGDPALVREEVPALT